MANVERPIPVATRAFTRRNGEVIHIAGYHPRDLAAYRMANGVTQKELADQIRTSQPNVSMYENPTRVPQVDEKQANEMLDSVDLLVKFREKIIAEGVALMAELRTSKPTTKVAKLSRAPK